MDQGSWTKALGPRFLDKGPRTKDLGLRFWVRGSETEILDRGSGTEVLGPRFWDQGSYKYKNRVRYRYLDSRIGVEAKLSSFFAFVMTSSVLI